MRKIYDSFYRKYESKGLRKIVDGAGLSTYYSKTNVREPQSSLHVLLHLLLLCMRVRWRGRVADLRVSS